MSMKNVLGNYKATLSPENLENASNFEGWSLTLVPYKKGVMVKLVKW